MQLSLCANGVLEIQRTGPFDESNRNAIALCSAAHWSSVRNWTDEQGPAKRLPFCTSTVSRISSDDSGSRLLTVGFSSQALVDGQRHRTRHGNADEGTVVAIV